MANEYGGSQQERMEDGNAVPAVRQQGTDVNLNYDVLPVPHSEVGSVDSAGVPLLCRPATPRGDVAMWSAERVVFCAPACLVAIKFVLNPCVRLQACRFTVVTTAGAETCL